MIKYEEALKLVQKHSREMGFEDISLENSLNRILDQNIISDRPLPPYNRAAMDGIAIHFQSYAQGQRKFSIEHLAKAGEAIKTLNSKENCIEIMTGAVCPEGADTIIRYEDLKISNGIAEVVATNIEANKNIHYKGSDIASGQILLQAGKMIDPPSIGIAASVGLPQLRVKKLPRTTIISTGDELVDIHQTVAPHQIRKSNVYVIASILKKYGIHAELKHLVDDRSAITEALKEIIESSDLIILSGGVSKGKFDFIPAVLEELGIAKVFHRVQQRPGKPLWFGQNDNTVVFGLPGNPVSSLACTYKYVQTWIDSCLKMNKSSQPYALLAEDFFFNPDLHLFLPVHVTCNKNGALNAHTYPGNGSGDFQNLKHANALMEIPRGKNHFKQGENYPIIWID